MLNMVLHASQKHVSIVIVSMFVDGSIQLKAPLCLNENA